VTRIYLLSIAILYLLASLRIASDRERIAIYRLSKFIGFRGPGIIITLLLIDRCTKIKIGDTGFMITSDIAEIKGVLLPVQTNEKLYVTDAVLIDKFINAVGGIKAIARKQHR